MRGDLDSWWGVLVYGSIPSRAAPTKAPAQRITTVMRTSAKGLPAILDLCLAFFADPPVDRLESSHDDFPTCWVLWAVAWVMPNLSVCFSYVDCHRFHHYWGGKLLRPSEVINWSARWRSETSANLSTTILSRRTPKVKKLSHKQTGNGQVS